jgi:hypothetical protein
MEVERRRVVESWSFKYCEVFQPPPIIKNEKSNKKLP